MIKNVEEIIVKEGRRPIDQDAVVKLAHSIKELGLLQPILINKENVMIAGNHRLEACKYLGWTEIDCTISDLEGPEAELAEIDENLIRTQMNDIEMGEMLQRRKVIYETIHPETKQGAKGGWHNSKTDKLENTSSDVSSFVADTAEKTGRSQSSIRNGLALAKLPLESKNIIRKTGLRTSDALKMTRKSQEEQKEIVALVVDESPAEAKKKLKVFLTKTKPCGKVAHSDLMKQLLAIEKVLFDKYEEYNMVFAEMGNEIENYQRLELTRQNIGNKVENHVLQEEIPSFTKDDELVLLSMALKELETELPEPAKKHSWLPSLNDDRVPCQTTPKKKFPFKSSNTLQALA